MDNSKDHSPKEPEKACVKTHRSDHTLEDELVYWTPERMRKAKPLPIERPAEPDEDSSTNNEEEGMNNG